MKKFATTLAALAASTVAVQAADMAARPVYKAPPPAMIDSWAGFYAGVNVGYSWGDWRSDSNQPIFNFEHFDARPKVDGVLGGIQAGYNWRVAPQWLFGIEADFQGTGEKAREDWIDPGLPIPNRVPADFVPRIGGQANLSSEWKFPWFGTVRLRTGYNPTPDWLLYVTGGLAYGRSEYNFNFSQPGAAFVPAPTTYALRQSSTNVGYSVGAGAEVKLNPNWSVKFEYLFVDLGKRSIVTTDIDGAPFSVSYRVRDNIARVGLNYAFGGGGPIVARY